MKKILFTIVMVILNTSIVQADNIRVIKANGSGSGCRSLTHSTDENVVSIDLNGNYRADTGAASGSSVSMDCDITIEVQVPSGVQIAVVDMRYKGFVYVPFGGKAELESKYKFSNVRVGSLFSQPFYYPEDRGFVLTDTAETTEWSSCGGRELMKKCGDAAVFYSISYGTGKKIGSGQYLDFGRWFEWNGITDNEFCEL